MSYLSDVWGYLLFDADGVTSKQVKKWRFLQGLDCSDESVRETKREIFDSFKEDCTEMPMSVPGVTVSFDETPQGRFLNYNLMKEEFTLGHSGYGGGDWSERLGSLKDTMEYFLQLLKTRKNSTSEYRGS